MSVLFVSALNWQVYKERTRLTKSCLTHKKFLHNVGFLDVDPSVKLIYDLKVFFSKEDSYFLIF